jgi:hypothetical protein
MNLKRDSGLMVSNFSAEALAAGVRLVISSVIGAISIV